MSKRSVLAGLLMSAVLMGSAVAQRGPGGGGMGPRGGMQGPGAQSGQQRQGGGPGGERGDQRRGHGDPQQHLDRMAKDLNLTAAQKGQVQTILADHGKQLDALRDDTSLTPEQKRDKMQQIRADAQSQIRDILTTEQQAEFDKHAPKGPKGPKDEHGHDGPPPEKQ